MEFLEANSLSDVQAPKVRPRTASKSTTQSSCTGGEDKDKDKDKEEEEEEEEDEEILNLAAALKASMDLPPPPSVQTSASTILSSGDGLDTESLKCEEVSTASMTTSTSQSLYDNISLAETAEPEGNWGQWMFFTLIIHQPTKYHFLTYIPLFVICVRL